MSCFKELFKFNSDFYKLASFDVPDFLSREEYNEYIKGDFIQSIFTKMPYITDSLINFSQSFHSLHNNISKIIEVKLQIKNTQRNFYESLLDEKLDQLIEYAADNHIYGFNKLLIALEYINNTNNDMEASMAAGMIINKFENAIDNISEHNLQEVNHQIQNCYVSAINISNTEVSVLGFYTLLNKVLEIIQRLKWIFNLFKMRDFNNYFNEQRSYIKKQLKILFEVIDFDQKDLQEQKEIQDKQQFENKLLEQAPLPEIIEEEDEEGNITRKVSDKYRKEFLSGNIDNLHPGIWNTQKQYPKSEDEFDKLTKQVENLDENTRTPWYKYKWDGSR